MTLRRGCRAKPQDKSVSSIVRCIICYKRVGCGPADDDLSSEVSSIQLLQALSKALRVSDTIYSNADIDTLPTTPFCSDCTFLIYDAVRILKEIKKLEVNWSCIANTLKHNLSESHRQHYYRCGPGISTNQIASVESIRKTLLQCFTTCSVNVSSGETRIDTLEDPIDEIPAGNSIKQESLDFQNVLSDSSDFDISQIKLDLTGNENQHDVLSLTEETFDNLSTEFEDIVQNSITNTKSPSVDFKDGQLLRDSSNVEQIQMNSRVINFEKNTRSAETLNILKCRYCPKAYRLKTYLDAHELQHKGKLDVECQRCNRAFVSVRSLRLHQSMQRQCHLDKTKNADSFQRKTKQTSCTMKITHTATSSRTSFKRSLTSFTCHQCKTDFIKEEYRRDSGYYIFKCSIPGCDKSFYNFSLFRRHHERTCPDKNVKGFRCRYCDKSFASTSNRSTHEIALHTKQFKYVCEECGHGAVTPSHLKKHMLIHTDEKAFKCYLCPKSFKRNVQLVYHVRRHNNELPFLCGTCGKRFVNLQHLQSHETIHLEKKNVPCPICNKMFINKGYVRNHVYGFHRKSRKSR